MHSKFSLKGWKTDWIQFNFKLPVKRNCNQSKNTSANCYIAQKVVQRTIESTKWPIGIQHVDKIEHTVERGHH